MTDASPERTQYCATRAHPLPPRNHFYLPATPPLRLIEWFEGRIHAWWRSRRARRRPVTLEAPLLADIGLRGHAPAPSLGEAGAGPRPGTCSQGSSG